MKRRDEVLQARLRLATKLRCEQDVETRRAERARVPAVVVLAEGTNSTVQTTSCAVEVIRELDGTATLETAVRRVARDRRLDAAGASKLRRDALRLARELLELGAVTFAR